MWSLKILILKTIIDIYRKMWLPTLWMRMASRYRIYCIFFFVDFCERKKRAGCVTVAHTDQACGIIMSAAKIVPHGNTFLRSDKGNKNQGSRDRTSWWLGGREHSFHSIVIPTRVLAGVRPQAQSPAVLQKLPPMSAHPSPGQRGITSTVV
jgi:hypothetical protein